MPALVHSFMSATVWAPLPMAEQMEPLSTLLHEQITAVSDRPPTPMVTGPDPLRAGKMSSSGCSGVGMSPRTICTRVW